MSSKWNSSSKDGNKSSVSSSSSSLFAGDAYDWREFEDKIHTEINGGDRHGRDLWTHMNTVYAVNDPTPDTFTLLDEPARPAGFLDPNPNQQQQEAITRYLAIEKSVKAHNERVDKIHRGAIDKIWILCSSNVQEAVRHACQDAYTLWNALKEMYKPINNNQSVMQGHLERYFTTKMKNDESLEAFMVELNKRKRDALVPNEMHEVFIRSLPHENKMRWGPIAPRLHDMLKTFNRDRAEVDVATMISRMVDEDQKQRLDSKRMGQFQSKHNDYAKKFFAVISSAKSSCANCTCSNCKPSGGDDQKSKKGSSGAGQDSKKKKPDGNYICFNCNQKGHFIADCPAKKCGYCQQKGHKSDTCPKRIHSDDKDKTKSKKKSTTSKKSNSSSGKPQKKRPRFSNEDADDAEESDDASESSWDNNDSSDDGSVASSRSSKSSKRSSGGYSSKRGGSSSYVRMVRRVPKAYSGVRSVGVVEDPDDIRFVVDSGAEEHLSPSREDFVSYTDTDQVPLLIAIDGSKIDCSGVGVVVPHVLVNVMLCPSATARIVSVPRLQSCGMLITFHAGVLGGSITDTHGTVVPINEDNSVLLSDLRKLVPARVFRMDTQVLKLYGTMSVEERVKVMHLCGCISQDQMCKLAESSINYPVSVEEIKKHFPSECVICLMSKAKRKRISTKKQLKKMSNKSVRFCAEESLNSSNSLLSNDNNNYMRNDKERVVLSIFPPVMST